MVKKVNAIGDACPIPVIKAKNALKELNGAGTVEIMVDNEVAVQNLTRLANQQGCSVTSEKLSEGQFQVTIETDGSAANAAAEEIAETCPATSGRKKNVVVAITSPRMGTGNDELGAVLIKGFIFALTQQDTLPTTMLFYNGGAMLTAEGSASLEDLKSLAAQGVEILTCGTCLNYYGLSDKLQVGEVTNMYSIVEKLTNADLIVKP